MTLPENYRGGYFLWFLKDRHLLQNAHDKTKHARLNFLAKARPSLDSIDEDKDLSTLKSAAKSEIYKLYDLVLEQRIGAAYKKPIESCSFTELWTAYQNHTLISLFDANGP